MTSLSRPDGLRRGRPEENVCCIVRHVQSTTQSASGSNWTMTNHTKKCVEQLHVLASFLTPIFNLTGINACVSGLSGRIQTCALRCSSLTLKKKKLSKLHGDPLPPLSVFLSFFFSFFFFCFLFLFLSDSEL